MEVLVQIFVSVSAHVIGWFLFRLIDRHTKGR